MKLIGGNRTLRPPPPGRPDMLRVCVYWKLIGGVQVLLLVDIARRLMQLHVVVAALLGVFQNYMRSYSNLRVLWWDTCIVANYRTPT